MNNLFCFYPPNHFIKENFKHRENLKEFYVSAYMPTDPTVNTLLYLLNRMSGTSLHPPTHPSIPPSFYFFESFQRKLWTSVSFTRKHFRMYIINKSSVFVYLFFFLDKIYIQEMPRSELYLNLKDG